jgi:hypothetical protein
MKKQYQVRQMTDNKVVKSFNTSEEAEQWLKSTFYGISEIVKYYVSMEVEEPESLEELFEMSDRIMNEYEEAYNELSDDDYIQYKEPIDIMSEDFDSEAKEYLTLLAIQYRGDWDAINSAIANRQLITINRDKVLMNLYHSDIKVVTIFEDEYPELLKQSYKAPFVLFYVGDLNLINYATQSTGIIGDDLEDAVVDYLIHSGNFVTMVGKEQIEITDGVSNVFVSTTFGNTMNVSENARMFSSLSNKVLLDSSEESNFSSLVLLYANKFDIPLIATKSGWVEDVAGKSITLVDSFEQMIV